MRHLRQTLGSWLRSFFELTPFGKPKAHRKIGGRAKWTVTLSCSPCTMVVSPLQPLDPSVAIKSEACRPSTAMHWCSSLAPLASGPLPNPLRLPVIGRFSSGFYCSGDESGTACMNLVSLDSLSRFSVVRIMAVIHACAL